MNTPFKSFKNTRFLFVVNTLGSFGGAERQAFILAHYIKVNVSPYVTFIAINQNGTEFKSLLEKEGIENYYFPIKQNVSKYKKVIQLYKLTRFIKQLKPDVIIPYVAESNKIVAQIWHYTGACFAFWNQREEGRKLYGTPYEQKLIRRVPAIVSNSYEGRNALVQVYQLQQEQIKVINNGIIPYTQDIVFYDWHAHFGISKERPLVSMIANITNRKDHETLLQAWHIVIKSCREKQLALPFLVLAGRKAETYDALRLLGFDLKLCEHIGFTGTLKTVQELIRQSYFCVFSSNLEGCPNGVLECMEQGKAVVGTHISGVEQALGTAYKDICLSKPNNAQDLANKIIALYDQPALIQEIGTHNRQRIENEFSVEQMVEGYLQLIPGQFSKT